ncbi:MAG TPA: WD40 repeat domain-containing protein [Gemmataceae bacterium]|jgi:WD40 repeat protein
MSTFPHRIVSVSMLVSLLLVAASITSRAVRAAEPSSEKKTRRDRFGDPLPEDVLYRVGAARFRLGWPVYLVAFSKDGKTLLSVQGTVLRRWDAATGKQLREISLDGKNGISYDVLSPNGALLAALDHSKGGGPIRVVDASSGRLLHRFDMRGSGGIAFAPNGRTLAATGGGTIHFWDLASGKVLGELKGEDSSGGALAFSPDGKLLASARQDDGVLLWDVPGRRQLRRLPPAKLTESNYALTFSSDGKLLAAHDGGEIRLWNTATGKKLWTIRHNGHSASALIFSPDGKIIASSKDYGVACLWEVATGKEVRKLGRRVDLHCLAFSPDGALLAVGEENIRLYRVATGEELRPAGEGALDIDKVAFTPDGRLLVTSETDGLIRLWDADTGVLVRRFKGRLEGNSFVGFSEDGKSLFTRHEIRHDTPRGKDLFCQWDLHSGEEQRSVPAPTSAICAALSSSGRVLAWASEEGAIHLRDMATGKELRSWRTKGKVWSDLQTYYHALRFSAQDKLLGIGRLFGGQSEVRMVETGAECSFSKRGGEYLAFSSDGRIAARIVPKKNSGNLFGTAWRGPDDEQLIGFQDTTTGEEFARTDLTAVLDVSLGDFISADATVFSPDGRTFVTAIKWQPVRFWETATGKERYRLSPEPSGKVEQLAFSPDGNKLAPTGAAKNVLVWRVFGPRPGQRPVELSAPEVRNAWAELASKDGQIAFRAIRALTASPHSAVDLLRREVHPIPRLDPQRLVRLIDELDAEAFPVREKAVAELGKLGFTVEEALHNALRNRPTLEARRRLEGLLAQLQKQRTAADTVRQRRALEVLEHLATPEARRLLDELAQGEPAARLTREAKASLARLDRHHPPKP